MDDLIKDVAEKAIEERLGGEVSPEMLHEGEQLLGLAVKHAEGDGGNSNELLQQGAALLGLGAAHTAHDTDEATQSNADTTGDSDSSDDSSNQ